MKRRIAAQTTTVILVSAGLALPVLDEQHTTASAFPAAALPGADQASTEDSGPPGYELAWSDEFDGNALNTDEWMHRTDQRFICANRPENVSVSEGKLRIALRKEEADGMPYTCGGVISERWFGYGYYETRAKLWSDQGFHSSFWQAGLRVNSQQGAVADYRGPHNLVNEIDGFEIDSHAPTAVHSTTHYYIPTHVSYRTFTHEGPDSGADYNTYGWEWKPDEVTFYVNGVATGTIEYPGPHGMQNVWLTSLGMTPPVDETNLPGEVTFDYFRYYQKADTPRPAVDAVIVDNDDRGYAEAGSWLSTTDSYGFNDRNTRYTEDTGASATWSTRFIRHRKYEVYVWVPSFYANSDMAAEYTVTHANGDTTVAVNQVTAGQQWVPLGAYEFDPAKPAVVEVEKDDPETGALRADAVMFVPSTVVDDAAPGYAEAGQWDDWTEESFGGTARWTVDPDARASWTLPTSWGGHHDVYAWIPEHDGSAGKATYTIRGRGLDRVSNIDQSAYQGEWAFLGNYRLAGMSDVDITVEGTDGVLLADAVRAVPNTPPNANAPAPPASVTGDVDVEGADESANVTWRWTKSDERDVTGYNVFLDGVQVNWQPVSGTSFMLPDLRFGQPYQISVTAVDNSGNESEPTHATIQTPADTTAPSPPHSIQADPINNGAVLTWAHAGAGVENDLGGFNIFVDGQQINSDPTNPEEFGYFINGLVNGQTYDLAVSAVDYSGNVSPLSETISVTVEPAFVVDAMDPGYSESGAWTFSGVRGWAGTSSRTSNEADATARWDVELPESDEYTVFAWIPNHINSTPSAKYTIEHAAGTSSVLKSQRAGGQDWVELGCYSFTAEDGGAVELANAAASGWLRSSAVKLVRGECPIEVPEEKTEYVIDNEEPGSDFQSDGSITKTGTWLQSGLSGFSESTSEFSNDPGATYTWETRLPSAGEYEIFVYNIQATNSDPATQFVVNDQEDSMVIVDQAQTETGWFSLGVFSLAADQESNVTLTRGSGYARADAVKFVPIEDSTG